MTRAYRRRSTIGSIEQRGAKFRIRWTDENKRRHDKSGFATYKEADEELLRIQLGMSSPTSTMPWKSYYESHVRPTYGSLKPKTVHEYERQWSHDLEPLIGSSEVGKTTWRTVQSVMDKLPTESVQRHAFALLKKMCNMAMRDGLLDLNPCDRSIRFTHTKKREKTVPEPDALLRLLAALEGTKYESVILAMLACGLRVEEALALDWEDFDDTVIGGREYLTASISKTLVTVGTSAVEQDSTKNDYSQRTVVIGEPFASRLREIRSEGALVPNGKGGRTAPSTISTNWKLWCERNAEQYVPLGQMRSVYATLACEAADSSLVSLVMGHSDGTTRGRNYQQSNLRGMAIVADAYAEYLSEWDTNGTQNAVTASKNL